MSKQPAEKVLIGTSGWSYSDWVGPFYREGTVAGRYLSEYAKRFPVVEVDSTFYAIPSVRTVEGWAEKSGDDFRFALKIPGAITHGAQGSRARPDRVLVDEEGKLETFLDCLEPLGEKLGPLVFQFPYFRVAELDAADFMGRLAATLAKLPRDTRFAVEIRNRKWITPEYLDLLREHGAAAVLVDHPYMPLPYEQLELDMVTTDFAYIRLLGDRYAIEKKTKKWGEIVEDKRNRLKTWAEVIREIAARRGVNAAYAFANNHFAGHGPATSRQLYEFVRST